MRSVKLLIAFQGTRYEGWQSQKKDRTLQEVFEKTLQKILNQKTTLIGSSRTDSGVHARGFVAHFKTQSTLPDQKIKHALNFYLPRDILVLSAKTVSNSFHARYDAKSKVYQYQIWQSATRPLFEAPYVLWHPYQLNVAAMKKAAKRFVGRHDFSAFRASGGEAERSAVRQIKSFRIQKNKELICMDIEANGFLRHMIRILVGTLLEVGRGKILPRAIPLIINSKDRSKAGPTARALGLTLMKVKY